MVGPRHSYKWTKIFQHPKTSLLSSTWARAALLTNFAGVADSWFRNCARLAKTRVFCRVADFYSNPPHRGLRGIPRHRRLSSFSAVAGWHNRRVPSATSIPWSHSGESKAHRRLYRRRRARNRAAKCVWTRVPLFGKARKLLDRGRQHSYAACIVMTALSKKVAQRETWSPVWRAR